MTHINANTDIVKSINFYTSEAAVLSTLKPPPLAENLPAGVFALRSGRRKAFVLILLRAVFFFGFVGDVGQASAPEAALLHIQRAGEGEVKA